MNGAPQLVTLAKWCPCRSISRRIASNPAPEVADRMRHKPLQTLYSYWNELRAGRLAPRRLEIEPSRIAPILANTFMLERAGPAAYQFRLAGTRLCEVFGFELRGSGFLAGWSGPDRAVLERELAAVCERGAILTLGMEAGADTRHRLELEVILLPLTHAGTTITRIIGAMGTAANPHWLATQRLTERRLLRHELTWPDGRPHSVVERSGHKVPFARALGDIRIVRRERRAFRVLQGGRTDPEPRKG